MWLSGKLSRLFLLESDLRSFVLLTLLNYLLFTLRLTSTGLVIDVKLLLFSLILAFNTLFSPLYSSGCVVYEMCALVPPFRADDMNGLFKKVLKG